MQVTRYRNCVSVKFSEIPNSKIKRYNKDFFVPLTLPGGTETEVQIIAHRRKDGTYAVSEILLDISLDKRDVANIAELCWYIFPAEQRGRKLPPIVESWIEDETVIAACLNHQRYGGDREPWGQQLARLSDETNPPGPERMLCWWPDRQAWEIARGVVSQTKFVPNVGFAYPFYTFSEWFARPDVSVNHTDRATEYARYICKLRTMLLYHMQRNYKVKVTLGNVDTAMQYFKENRLDPNNQTFWSNVVTEFGEMPEVFVERKYPCGPVGVVRSGIERVAVVNMISHLPGVAQSLDCVGAAVFDGDVELCRIFIWCNPLFSASFSASFFEKAMDALFAECDKLNVSQLMFNDNLVPFNVCPECGEMILSGIGDFLETKRKG